MSDSAKWHRYLRFWRPNITADVNDELAFHVEARTDELLTAGLDRAAARAQAMREFGDVQGTTAALRAMDERHAADERRAHVATDLLRDVIVAYRALRRSPGLVAIVVLTFALGIGVTSATYSVVDAYLFRPLPDAHGADLVVLARTDKDIPLPHPLSFPDYKDFRSDTAIFASLAAYSSRIVDLNTDRGADRIWIDDATANYFSTLGLAPMLGRTFSPGDDKGVLAHPEIVLTFKAWTAHFGGDSSIIGRVIRINDHPVTVIAVMPPAFHGVRALIDIDAVAPLNQLWPAAGSDLDDRSAFLLDVFGQLRSGVSVARAKTAVHLVARQLARAYPTTNKTVDAVLAPEHFSRPSPAVSNAIPAVAAVFMTLVMLVLLVACANVASVLLARVVVRGRELAIRAALGASAWRLVRQVLVECAILGALGGIGAVGVAYLALDGIQSIQIATDLPIRWGVGLDHRVLFFTAFATLIASVVAGLAPVAAARKRDLHSLLKSSVGNSASAGHARLRATLVVAQIAISVVVLSCAGLFVRSSRNVGHMSFGFRSDHITMVSTALGPQTYDSVHGRDAYRNLLARAAAVPGVRSVGLTRYIPFGFSRDNVNVFPVASSVSVPADGFNYFCDVVSGDYFAAMDIPILTGRAFTDRDDASAPAVAIVNDAFVKTMWPGQPPIGKRFRAGGANGPIVEIVGVVRGMQDLIPGEPPKPYVFRPLSQSYQAEMTLVAHTAVNPSTLIPSLRAAIVAVDPTLPVFDARTMDDHLRNGQALLFTRIGSAFAAVFGLLALVLATVGVYGVVSYSVAQRTREIGVRVALGARMPAIARLVVGQGMRLAYIGGAIGVLLAIVAAQALSSVLYGVTPRDPTCSAAPWCS